ncbi:MAG TPA: hypothetical protein VJ796_08040 [Acidimicrobiia bacterium]|jgi:hypothetical protein|nr:hypothetical protein [Acidimicrobiia bacterium]
MKAHKFDAWSFVGGLVLIVVGLFVLLPNTSTLLELQQLSLFFDLILPVLALVVGVALVVPALRRRQPDEVSAFESEALTAEEARALEELNDSSPPMA